MLPLLHGLHLLRETHPVLRRGGTVLLPPLSLRLPLHQRRAMHVHAAPVLRVLPQSQVLRVHGRHFPAEGGREGRREEGGDRVGDRVRRFFADF